MANHDLLSDDDFFSRLKKEKDQEEKEDSAEDRQEPAAKETDPEDDLFTSPPLPDEEESADTYDTPEFPSQPPQQYPQDEPEDSIPEINEFEDQLSKDFHQDVQSGLNLDRVDQLAEQELSEELQSAEDQERPAPSRDEFSIDNYEDEKLDRISYKPFVIGAAIIAVMVIIYFVLKTFLFNDAAPKAEQRSPETNVVEQTTAPSPSPEEIRRNRFLGNLAQTTGHELNSINTLISLASSKAKVSSVLLYEDQFLFEVFGKDRGVLARLNIDLKNEFKNRKFEVVSSSQRPGSNGGVFGLYRLNPNGSSSGAGDAKDMQRLTSVGQANDWLSNLAASNDLSVKQIKTLSTKQQDDFQVTEVEAVLEGSLPGCTAFLRGMAQAGKNVAVHKLALNARDQTNFNAANYQLRLIGKLYL